MTSLLSRLTRRRPSASHLTLIVYTRRQCCCCHKAIEHLKREQRRYGFAIEVVDVDSDPVLVKRFGELVPVVTIGNKVRFRGQVNPVLLERLLRAESRRQGH